MLADDRVPAVVRWFTVQTSTLPAEMRHELTVWFDIARHGSATPPRSRPRSERTVRPQPSFALPMLRNWAREHASLREIDRDDVLNALPPSGAPRSCTPQGLRSIFRVLKARHLTSTNPTARIRVPNPRSRAPAPIDLSELRAALDSEDPTCAALAALPAFHAIRIRELRAPHLADLRGGRLHIDDRVIPLAVPVRLGLTAYLTCRQRSWPNTANPHLFIHHRNATTVDHSGISSGRFDPR